MKRKRNARENRKLCRSRLVWFCWFSIYIIQHCVHHQVVQLSARWPVSSLRSTLGASAPSSRSFA